MGVSVAADINGVWRKGNARQAGQRAVLLEGVGKLDHAGHILSVVGEGVVVQAASEQQAKGECCQRLLTVGKHVCSGILQQFKG